MSAPAFLRSVSTFCELVTEQNFALSLQAHVIKPLPAGRSRVSWVMNTHDEEGNLAGYRRTPDVDLTEYLRCLRFREYSLLMNDGGIIQITADFHNSEIVAHRFCYLPCPINFQIDELHIDDELYPLDDFINDLNADEIRNRLCIRSPFRFELDSQNEGADHPLSHVHFGRTDARVPVSAAMCWDHFARFIFSRFYPEAFQESAYLLRFPVSYRARTISETQAQELHFAFSTLLY